jgi:uncharacterized protein (TIGR02145 family)
LKNLSIYFIFFFISGISLAQSKKEMIAILTNRVDSLNQIVASERSDKQKLNIEISKLKNQIKDLERNNENLSTDKSALETKNNALDKQLKIKKDSLVLVTTELLKYRPAPKPVIVVKQDNTGSIKTVTIGRQVWMLENLNVSTFKNGVAIPAVQDQDAWCKAGDNKQPAWCYYDNDPKNGVKYGKLYNWYAVIDNNGLCPQGWHVPSDAEWDTLVAYLGGESVAGGKMKEVGTTSWNGPNIDATNTSLFTGLPGGLRYNDGSYISYFGDAGSWWSSTEFNTYYAWFRFLYGYQGLANRADGNKKSGLSVRCLKD